jgi:hypothetical protein
MVVFHIRDAPTSELLNLIRSSVAMVLGGFLLSASGGSIHIRRRSVGRREPTKDFESAGYYIVSVERCGNCGTTMAQFRLPIMKS